MANAFDSDSIFQRALGTLVRTATDRSDAIGASHRPTSRRRRLGFPFSTADPRQPARALKQHWGDSTFTAWLETTEVRLQLEGILAEDLGEPGFTTLDRRIMDATKREPINGFFCSLGDAIRQPQEIYVGGSSAEHNWYIVYGDRIFFD
jgi:hypothetical protein